MLSVLNVMYVADADANLLINFVLNNTETLFSRLRNLYSILLILASLLFVYAT